MHIIHDGTKVEELNIEGHGRGLDLSNRPRGRAYEGTAEPFPDSLLIPDSDWQGMIEEREARKATLQNLVDENGLIVKNQEQTNYCWINSPAYATEVIGVVQGDKHVELSPASAGAQITNYRNVGGWGKTGLDFIVNKGLVPSRLWPNNAINRQFATPANLAEAMKYRVQEWWELEVRNLRQVVSCLLRGWPICVGLNWWSHEITYLDPKWLDGTIAILFANSWGRGYGTNGYGILQGNRMQPDDAVVPRTRRIAA